MSKATSVARRLYRAFAMVILVLLITGVIASFAAWQQYRSVDALTGQVMPERLANSRVFLELMESQRGICNYLLNNDPAFEDVYRDDKREYQFAAQELRRTTMPEDRAAVAVELERADAWFAIAGRQRQVQPGSDEDVCFAHQGGPTFDLFLSSNAHLDRTLTHRGDVLRARTRTAELTAAGTLIATAGLGILAALIVAVRTARRVKRMFKDEKKHARAQARAQARAEARAQSKMREAGLRIRENVSVDAALDAAARVLGPAFRADLAVVRLAGAEHQEQRTAWWSASDRDGARPLSAQPVSWLADRHARGDVWRSGDVRTDPNGAPDSERKELLAAGAVSALTVPFGAGPVPDGAITLVRRTDDAPWLPAEVEAAGQVASDVSRWVQQSHLYEREQRLEAQLRDLDRSKDIFLSTVSHELRTPLTSISGFVELLADTASGPLTDDQRHMLAIVERNTNRLRGMIEDLLTLSRIETGTLRTVRESTDVTELVDHAVRSVAAPPDVNVYTHCPPKSMVADVDPHQIERVLTNLLSNAVKFTPAGGEVVVSVREDGNHVVLTVSDTGIGIPHDEQAELFTRFFRASNAVEASIPGTGLGLTIVRNIVANHDGEVKLRSEPGEGTTVTVRLPRERVYAA
ncbi:GAF domain-containing sensor histidine kinase [Planosporangium thailandense]|uniref:histidine kinase n=1 Tax=Planosporangium thailandense TaxID=765197 RepID=A0ABX0Y100_9ACTN|nr:GAF domain-containing sensor histidine kinase [Planosporangium thailandense]NJC71120.1 GAF domain-containing sensor histidine kinase [Planosporangium thailandense]